MRSASWHVLQHSNAVMNVGHSLHLPCAAAARQWPARDGLSVPAIRRIPLSGDFSTLHPVN
jgi:hypothetical protein